MSRQERVIEKLRARLAELDAELDASGVEDALDWERFPEMERVMYALAERELEQEWAESREVAEREEIIELAEMAEEAALAELGAFGFIEFEPQFNWSAKSTPEDRGWSRAVLDIIAEYGAADTEPVFELF